MSKEEILNTFTEQITFNSNEPHKHVKAKKKLSRETNDLRIKIKSACFDNYINKKN